AQPADAAEQIEEARSVDAGTGPGEALEFGDELARGRLAAEAACVEEAGAGGGALGGRADPAREQVGEPGEQGASVARGGAREGRRGGVSCGRSMIDGGHREG